jgi:hypothetical protein
MTVYGSYLTVCMCYSSYCSRIYVLTKVIAVLSHVRMTIDGMWIGYWVY